MKPSYHIAGSCLLGLLFFAFIRDVKHTMVFIFSGILIDLDHIFDYCLSNKARTFNPVKFYRGFSKWCLDMEFDIIYLFLHSFEFLLLLWGVIWFAELGTFWVAVAAGFTQHLILDLLFNRVFQGEKFYFFFYRIMKSFAKVALLRK